MQNCGDQELGCLSRVTLVYIEKAHGLKEGGLCVRTKKLYSSLLIFFQQVQGPDICPEKPEIIEQPSINQVYYVGDQMNLSCEVLCSKPVVFTCFLNNEMLAGGFFFICTMYRTFLLSL